MRTGELAERAGVNVETLRFYERQGLLPVPPRRTSGYREYPAEAVDLVRFIRRAQHLGFSLREIKELLNLRAVPRATCADVAGLAQRKIEDVDAKIRDLRAVRSALAELVNECPRAAPLAQCPIIESLSREPIPKRDHRPKRKS
ncbi:MAG: MerR family DNA-binding protein [Planctomycetia bacterium]|nr:MerR family DNA-binding protein [Planctomycetia bacterium]